jgi:hypothetical protein
LKEWTFLDMVGLMDVLSKLSMATSCLYNFARS